MDRLRDLRATSLVNVHLAQVRRVTSSALRGVHPVRATTSYVLRTDARSSAAPA